jgi:hypothetical protein
MSTPIPATLDRRPDGTVRRLTVARGEHVGVYLAQPRAAHYRLDSVEFRPDGSFTAMLVKQRKTMTGGGDYTRGGRIVLDREAMERDHPEFVARILLSAPPVDLDEPDGCADCAEPGDFAATGGVCEPCLRSGTTD